MHEEEKKGDCEFQKCFWIAGLQKWQKARLPVGEVFDSEEVKG